MVVIHPRAPLPDATPRPAAPEESILDVRAVLITDDRADGAGRALACWRDCSRLGGGLSAVGKSARPLGKGVGKTRNRRQPLRGAGAAGAQGPDLGPRPSQEQPGEQALGVDIAGVRVSSYHLLTGKVPGPRPRHSTRPRTRGVTLIPSHMELFAAEQEIGGRDAGERDSWCATFYAPSRRRAAIQRGPDRPAPQPRLSHC